MACGWLQLGRTGAALLVAALPLSAARADEEETETERSPVSMVIFGSMEAGPGKTFLSVGMKRALGGGLAQSGFRLFMKAGGSQEETRRRAPHGTTYKAESQALIGYEWRIGDSFLALYAGSDTESEQRMEPFGLAFVETRYGARLQGDYQTSSGLFQPYLKANIWHDFDATDTVRFDSDAMATQIKGTSVELGGGIVHGFNEAVSGFVTADYTFNAGGERQRVFEGNVGVRVKW